MMVWKRWLLLNMAIFGIHVRFQGCKLPIWVFPNRGKNLKMDGESNGKPYFLMGKHPYSWKYPFGGNQTIQTYGKFEGFPMQ